MTTHPLPAFQYRVRGAAEDRHTLEQAWHSRLCEAESKIAAHCRAHGITHDRITSYWVMLGHAYDALLATHGKDVAESQAALWTQAAHKCWVAIDLYHQGQALDMERRAAA